MNFIELLRNISYLVLFLSLKTVYLYGVEVKIAKLWNLEIDCVWSMVIFEEVGLLLEEKVAMRVRLLYEVVEIEGLLEWIVVVELRE